MLDLLFLFYQIHPIYSMTFMGIFFLCVGSFLNVLIYRLPQMIMSTWTQECELHLHLPMSNSETINLFYPRSFCTHCKQQIKAIHNLPILSFIYLKGRCATCGKKFSWQYPIVEGLCLLLSLSAWYCFGIGLLLVYALLLIWTLISLFFIDLNHQILPDCLTLSLVWLGLLANTQGLFTSLEMSVYGAIAGYLFLWLFTQIFYLITGKIGMGNGDFKLFAALGAWFGPLQLPLILLSSALIGSMVGILYLHYQEKSKETPIPFGPFLTVAGLLSLFWGKSFLTWYVESIPIFL